MTTTPTPQGNPDAPSSRERPDAPVQTGALPGGQPGEGTNTSSSPTGQSNADAVVRQGECAQKDEPLR